MSFFANMNIYILKKLNLILLCHVALLYFCFGVLLFSLFLYRVIQEELPPLIELISEDILSKKCHINRDPILNIYRVMFVIGIFLHFNFNYKITSSLCIYCHKNKLISVDLIFCSSILQRLQHIFKTASLRVDTLVRMFVNRARCST
jgi:hypothetical protein